MKKLFVTSASVLAVSAALILTAGCGQSAGDAQQATNNKLNAKGNPSIQDATYADACASSTVPDVGPIKFPGMQTFFELSALTFTKRVVYYSDANCKTELFEVREKGKLSAIANSGTVAGALEANFNYETTTVTMTDSNLIAASNTVSLCGIKDWSTAERDVSSQAAGLTCPGKPSPRVTSDLIMVQNNTTLFLGADADQDSAQPRPTAVNQSKPYTKQ